MFSRLILLFSILLTMSACAPGKIADDAISINQDVMRAEKTFTLLNILRSAHNEPLFFSTITNIDTRPLGSVSLSSEVAGSFIMREAEHLFDVDIQDDRPRFSLNQLNSASFIRTMSRPIELGVIERMFARSYNQELLTDLLISEVGWAGKPLSKTNSAESSAFVRRLRLLNGLGFDVEPLLGDNTLFEDLN